MAGPSVVMNAESGGWGGGMLSAPWAKPKAEIRTFHVSSKAFDIFCSVYLLKPTNIIHAPQFLKYRHTFSLLVLCCGMTRNLLTLNIIFI